MFKKTTKNCVLNLEVYQSHLRIYFCRSISAVWQKPRFESYPISEKSSKFTFCLDFGASKYCGLHSAANITFELTLGGFKPWQKTMLLVPFSSKTRWEMISKWLKPRTWNLWPDISDLHSSAQLSTAKLDLREEWCRSNFPSTNWEASSPWVQINRSHGLHVLTPKIYGDTMCLCLCINNIMRIIFSLLSVIIRQHSRIGSLSSPTVPGRWDNLTADASKARNKPQLNLCKNLRKHHLQRTMPLEIKC